MGIVERYLQKLKRKKRRLRHTAAVLTVLSLLVAIGVSWSLRQEGIAYANDTSCGWVEHVHKDSCLLQTTLICGAEADPEHVHTDLCYLQAYLCGYEEHIHSITCYSNPSADVESWLDWQAMFADYPYTENLREDLVGIAKTQVGYTESILNYELDFEGERRGYTRYGDWYGAPYNEWSAMFVSFCLHYAEADPEEYPISSGADTMAGLWNKAGRYEPVGEYVPVSGDLVFFDDNTVGIVVEVQKATLYVIAGDVDNTVSRDSLSMYDEAIEGWGVLDYELYEETLLEDLLPDEEESTGVPFTMDDLTEAQLYDISHGPAVFVISGTAPQQTQAYSFRNSRAIVDLSAYLQANEGTYFFTMLDFNNVELPKDPNGNYIAQANQNYKLSIGFSSPNGFLPGTYQYQVPNGLMVEGGNGKIILKDGTNVGTWVVTDTGLITLEFNDKMNNLTDTTISVTLGIKFPEQQDPLDFDGKITVTVEKPPQQQDPTQIYKWGKQGDTTKGEDPTKIYWTVQIVGRKDSQIPGNILSDQVLHGLWSKEHRYTESDIAGGLTIGVSEPNPLTGEAMGWHAWHVSPDDPHLIWTETGWSYKMPQTAVCQWCGEVVLGNENWIYTVNYTSTPNRESTAGTYGYENDASIDGQHAYGWGEMTHGDMHGEVIKTGSFVSDASNGSFAWELQILIPGMREGQKADYHWYVMDYMYLLNKDSHREGYVENHAHLATVRADINGTTVAVPSIEHATANDRFAWHNAWTATTDTGLGYGKEINLLCRCVCTEASCMYWNENSGCGTKYWLDGAETVSEYCQCWAVPEAVNFTFSYTTDSLPLIEAYGGFGNQVQNIAELYYKPNGYSEIGALVDTDQATVSIPAVFQKALTQDFDGYTAHYQITVNEARAVLTNGTPLVIHDAMTDTLAYIGGSLIVTTEDANGTKTTLQQDKHYTVAYDGTGDQTDADGNPVHVLEITILRPQPVKYILDYDTTLVMPEHVTGAIKYTNSAEITLWGEPVGSDTVEKVHAEINMAARSYSVELVKTCARSGKPLPDAVFGLYNDHGGLITSATTDENGYILFQTNIVEGIILREHQLYYIEETKAPAGYQPDHTKHRFIFCNETTGICQTCQEMLKGANVTRIPFEQLHQFRVINQPIMVALPATGGTGIAPYILCGVPLIAAPLVYRFGPRRKHERRVKK